MLLDEAKRVDTRYARSFDILPYPRKAPNQTALHNSNGPVIDFTTDQYKSYHVGRFNTLLDTLPNDAKAEKVQEKLQYYLDVLAPRSSHAACSIACGAS